MSSNSRAKSIARSLIGAVSPALLRRLQLARARRIYLQDPTRGPRRLLLEPTTGCNHQCIMCWDHSLRLTKPTPGWHMPFERVCALLREMAAMGTEEVWLAGRGEPLVHPKAKEILHTIGSLGLRSIITTNAGRLTQELADQLCGWGLQQLSISLDSGAPDTYAKVHGGPPEDRARILALIKHLSQRPDRPRLLVSMVLSQLNFRELLDLVRDAIDAGVTGVVVGGMRPVPFDSLDLALSDDDWAQVRDDLAKAAKLTRAAGIDLAVDNIRPAEKPRAQVPGSASADRDSGPPKAGLATWPYASMACFIGHLFTVIDVHGHVHGCCTCQNKLGSLDEASFRDIWWSRPYRLYRQVLREMPTTGLSAPRCECRHGCGHIPDNAQLQRELGFGLPKRAPESPFATRKDLAEALCRHLDAVLPPMAQHFAFADLHGESERAAASRLRRVGIMSGTGSMDGVSLFEPQRLVSRGDFEDVVRRALVASGLTTEKAEALIAQSRAGSGHPAEPLAKRDLEGWLSAISAPPGKG